MRAVRQTQTPLILDFYLRLLCGFQKGLCSSSTHRRESIGIGAQSQYGVAPKLRPVRIERYSDAMLHQIDADLTGRVAEEKRRSARGKNAINLRRKYQPLAGWIETDQMQIWN